MKSRILFLLCLATLQAWAVDVRFDLVYLTTGPASNRTVNCTPYPKGYVWVNGTNIVSPDRISFTTDASGSFTTNIVPAGYEVEIKGIFRNSTFYMNVTNSADTLLAKDLVISATNLPLANSWAYSSTVSDTRYAARNNGYTTNLVADHPTSTNLVNYGGLSSPGAGAYSQQIGEGATASGIYSSAFGYGAKATNYGTIGIGYGALAYGSNGLALGVNSIAYENDLALGQYAEATGTNAMAIGFGAIAAATYSAALGYLAEADHDFSLAIGPNAITTATNQIMLGTTGTVVTVLGTLQASGPLAITGSATNAPSTPGTISAWLPARVNGTNFWIPLYK